MPEHAPQRPVMLVILDGVGVNPSRENNAVAQARTPNLDACFAHYPHTLLQASGSAVGLPDGQMGNSEVGHLTIGCGEVVRQDLVVIDEAIAHGDFFDNAVLTAACDAAAAAERPLHLLGLVSDGGVHSHVAHLLAMLELCRRRGVRPVLHLIADGRDTAPRSVLRYLQQVEPLLEASGGRVATVCGRFYAMDRDNRWARIEQAWRAIVRGEGAAAETAHAAIVAAYGRGENDEFIVPTVIGTGEPLLAGDSLVFFNFRKDRARQMTAALFREDFDEFPRGDFSPITVTCMTEYDSWFRLPFAFEKDRPGATIAAVVSDAGLKQFHCAETEKYAHVTYFLNGGRGDAHAGEERVIIDSPKVATYDLCPEMSAAQVADAVITAMRSRQYAFVVVNFANGDMVGHSGIPAAVIRAVEVLDHEVGRLMSVARAEGFSVVLTADHGNCEEMLDPVTDQPQTQHTVYPVPCLVVDEPPWQLAVGAGLSSIAPTVLHLMGLRVPESMSGRSLLLRPVSR